MGGMVAADAPAPAVDPRRFNKCLNEVDQLTSNSSEGHAWRKYLLIESLREWAPAAATTTSGCRATWRSRCSSVQPDVGHFASAAVPHLRADGRASPGDAAPHRRAGGSNRLLQHLENYEKSGLPSDARLLARDCQFLAVGTGAAQRELGERIEMHYRNANLRIAVTAELLNRMIPKREPEYAPVKDTIQGRAGSRPEPDGQRNCRADDPRSAPRPSGAGSQRRSGLGDPFGRRPGHVL